MKVEVSFGTLAYGRGSKKQHDETTNIVTPSLLRCYVARDVVVTLEGLNYNATRAIAFPFNEDGEAIVISFRWQNRFLLVLFLS